MGIFAVVSVDNSIDLPHFPEEIDRDGLRWQSKRGIDKYGGPYRVTADGRLEEKKQSSREKTDEEKQEEAEEWGLDSWEEYLSAYEERDSPFEESDIPTVPPTTETVDEVWWGDCNMHGSFEIHQLFQRDPIEYKEMPDPLGEENAIELPSEYALEVSLEYELRFTKGQLDDVVFIGERHEDQPIKSAISKIEDWREWKED